MFLKEEVIFSEEIKKSRFITLLFRVRSAQETRDLLASVKKQYPQATHCCSAWIIGSLSHCSDDGEPAGTAGRPMLDVLKGSGADQILAICVRYFGGTLLGKGGLVRAYSSGVASALALAKWSEAVEMGLYEASAPYSSAGKVEAWLRSLNLRDLECFYGEHGASFSWMSVQDLSDELSSRFSGQVSCSRIDTCLVEE